MSVRNTICTEIITALKTIQTGNGFSYDQDVSKVYDWIDEALDVEDADIILEMRDLPGSTEKQGGMWFNVLEIHISIIKAGVSTRQQVRNAMQDIVTAMITTYKAASSVQIDNIDYRGDNPEFEREVQPMGIVDMVFDVHYKTVIGTV